MELTETWQVESRTLSFRLEPTHNAQVKTNWKRKLRKLVTQIYLKKHQLNGVVCVCVHVSLNKKHWYCR